MADEVKVTDFDFNEEVHTIDLTNDNYKDCLGFYSPKEFYGWVYVLDFGSFYKIGKSKNISQRITQLIKSTNIPEGKKPLRVCISKRCTNYSFMENQLHHYFEDYHLTREFYNIPNRGIEDVLLDASNYIDDYYALKYNSLCDNMNNIVPMYSVVYGFPFNSLLEIANFIREVYIPWRDSNEKSLIKYKNKNFTKDTFSLFSIYAPEVLKQYCKSFDDFISLNKLYGKDYSSIMEHLCQIQKYLVEV